MNVPIHCMCYDVTRHVLLLFTSILCNRKNEARNIDDITLLATSSVDICCTPFQVQRQRVLHLIATMPRHFSFHCEMSQKLCVGCDNKLEFSFGFQTAKGRVIVRLKFGVVAHVALEMVGCLFRFVRSN